MTEEHAVHWVSAAIAVAFAIALAVALNGCNSAQVATAQQDQAQIQAGIASACASVNGAAALAVPFAAVPQVGALLDYATASCAGANAVAALTTKAVNDPATVAWANGLAGQISATVTQLKGGA